VPPAPHRLGVVHDVARDMTGTHGTLDDGTHHPAQALGRPRTEVDFGALQHGGHVVGGEVGHGDAADVREDVPQRPLVVGEGGLPHALAFLRLGVVLGQRSERGRPCGRGTGHHRCTPFVPLGFGQPCQRCGEGLADDFAIGTGPAHVHPVGAVGVSLGLR